MPAYCDRSTLARVSKALFNKRNLVVTPLSELARGLSISQSAHWIVCTKSPEKNLDHPSQLAGTVLANSHLPRAMMGRIDVSEICGGNPINQVELFDLLRRGSI